LKNEEKGQELKKKILETRKRAKNPIAYGKDRGGGILMGRGGEVLLQWGGVRAVTHNFLLKQETPRT